MSSSGRISVNPKDGTPNDNESTPATFVELWHWCESWASIESFEDEAWETDIDGLGVTAVLNYSSPQKPEFLRLATGYLNRLGDDIKAAQLEEFAVDASLTSLAQTVQQRCERGAELNGELPPGWFDLPTEGLSVPLPLFPLRVCGDFCRWNHMVLDASGRLPVKNRLHPAAALQLWTWYKLARFWIEQNRPDIQLPRVADDFDSAMKWWTDTEHHDSRQDCDLPECGAAERAIVELLTMVESTSPKQLQVKSGDPHVSSSADVNPLTRSADLKANCVTGTAEQPPFAATTNLCPSAVEENESPPKGTTRANQYLFGWPDILDRIGQPDEAKKRIQQLNRDCNGPIITSRGAKVKVDEEELLTWWNGLRDWWRHQEASTDETTTRMSQELQTFNFGRTATLVPEISGHVTQRVQGRNMK